MNGVSQACTYVRRLFSSICFTRSDDLDVPYKKARLKNLNIERALMQLPQNVCMYSTFFHKF